MKKKKEKKQLTSRKAFELILHASLPRLWVLGAGAGAGAGETTGVSVKTVSLRIVGGLNRASTALRATVAPAPKATPTNWKKKNLNSVQNWVIEY